MREPIDEQLDRRRRQAGARSRWGGVLTSILLHVGLGLALFFGPALLVSRSEPLEFVAVQIVPLQALGVRQPPPAPPKPKPQVQAPPPAPAPEPEPEKPEPEKAEEKKPEPKKSAPKETLPQPPSPAPTPASPRPESTSTAQRQGSPTGNPRGTAPVGAAVAALDNPDFTYGYYLDQMLGLIGANWRPPVTGEQLQAVVHFLVNRDGSIQDVTLAQSSGNSAFDLAGLRAVQSSSPLPPLPASYRHDSLGVNLILR